MCVLRRRKTSTQPGLPTRTDHSATGQPAAARARASSASLGIGFGIVVSYCQGLHNTHNSLLGRHEGQQLRRASLQSPLHLSRAFGLPLVAAPLHPPLFSLSLPRSHCTAPHGRTPPLRTSSSITRSLLPLFTSRSFVPRLVCTASIVSTGVCLILTLMLPSYKPARRPTTSSSPASFFSPPEWPAPLPRPALPTRKLRAAPRGLFCHGGSQDLRVSSPAAAVRPTGPAGAVAFITHRFSTTRPGSLGQSSAGTVRTSNLTYTPSPLAPTTAVHHFHHSPSTTISHP